MTDDMDDTDALNLGKMQPDELDFWRGVYSASIRCGHGPGGARREAQKAVMDLRRLTKNSEHSEHVEEAELLARDTARARLSARLRGCASRLGQSLAEFSKIIATEPIKHLRDVGHEQLRALVEHETYLVRLAGDVVQLEELYDELAARDTGGSRDR